MKEKAYLLKVEETLYWRFRAKCLEKRQSVKERLSILIKKDVGKKEG